MSKKPYDTTPPTKHKVRSHLRRMPSGLPVQVREYMRNRRIEGFTSYANDERVYYIKGGNGEEWVYEGHIYLDDYKPVLNEELMEQFGRDTQIAMMRQEDWGRFARIQVTVDENVVVSEIGDVLEGIMGPDEITYNDDYIGDYHEFLLKFED